MTTHSPRCFYIRDDGLSFNVSQTQSSYFTRFIPSPIRCNQNPLGERSKAIGGLKTQDSDHGGRREFWEHCGGVRPWSCRRYCMWKWVPPAAFLEIRLADLQSELSSPYVERLSTNFSRRHRNVPEPADYCKDTEEHANGKLLSG